MMTYRIPIFACCDRQRDRLCRAMSPGGGLDKLPYGCSPPQWLAQFIGNLNQIRVSVERIEALPQNARIGRINSMEIMNSTGVMTYRAKRKDVSVISFSLDHCNMSSRLPEMERYSQIPSSRHCCVSGPPSSSCNRDCRRTNDQYTYSDASSHSSHSSIL